MIVSRSSTRWLAGIALILVLATVVVVAQRQPRFEGTAEEAAIAGRSYVPQPLKVPVEAVLFREVFSVTDVTAKDGVWYILDRSGMQVHRLHPARGHLGSFGREGEGPGEFMGPSAVVSHGDSIVVADARTLRFFDLAGTHLGDRSLPLASGCFLHDAISMSEGLVIMARCSNLGTVDYYAAVETDADSLRVLGSHSSPRGSVISGMVLMGRHPQGVLFGFPYEECLNLIDFQGNVLNDVCHDWIERLAVPEMPDDVAAEMAALRQQSRELGFRMTLPEHLPPFKRISMTAAGRMVYHAAVPGNDTGMRLVVRSETGDQLVLPVRAARRLFVEGNNVLSAWDDLEGVRLLFDTIPEPYGQTTGPA